MSFLFVDRITELTMGVSVRGEKHVKPNDYYLCQDKAGKWCFIPTLAGEALGQLAAWNVMASNDFTARPVAGIAASALLSRPVYVGETLRMEAQIDRLDSSAVQYHGEVWVGDEIVFRLEGALGPLLPMADFIDPDVARQQFQAILEPPVPSLVSNRGTNDDLTHAPPMLFDRITESEPGVRLVAEKNILSNDPYFLDHFPRKPVLPMTLLLAFFLNLADEFVARAGYSGLYRCQRMRRVKMSDFIQPGDCVVGTMVLKQQTLNELTFVCRCDVGGKRVGVLELIMVLIGSHE